MPDEVERTKSIVWTRNDTNPDKKNLYSQSLLAYHELRSSLVVSCGDRLSIFVKTWVQLDPYFSDDWMLGVFCMSDCQHAASCSPRSRDTGHVLIG